jgi:hypothetical protein
MDDFGFAIAYDHNCRFVLLLVFGAALYGLVNELSEGLRAARHAGRPDQSNQGRRP